MSSDKTIVLIHGLSEERSAWKRQIAFLSDHMNVVAYDVRGFGSSPVGAGNGTVHQMADDLAQIVSAQDGSNGGTGSVYLCGFSMGGVISQRFALDFPDLCSGLILIASSCVVGHPGAEFFTQRLSDVEAGGLDTLNATNTSDARGCFAPDKESNEPLIAEYQKLRTEAVRDVNGYLNAGRAMLRLNTEPMIQDLGAIQHPTLVIAGELDPFCPPRASEMITDGIPSAEMCVIPAVGHCLHWEEPDVTNNLIKEFVDTH
ncbi:MAG: alpha/beta fold hydrolase [Rhodospirillales bacterium]|nr:alpha/beta fold hydrolase [Rhodospirillales bacterium]MBT4039353.1 alpha/beta fold hydrolase [Rhodospirillales bacterium]MBT4626245.1 alpha/beta fold hydrolase [Rhodospirillales bacterium]MBT5353086.1 alpha/beta fold hydrolase [Rhodospirillales bacterium]MBT5520773.1 alpha/beta fold hydrolase [Rhodospirillales bacterium]